MSELLIYHKSAVESLKKEREEVAILNSLAFNGQLGKYLSGEKETRVDEVDDGTPDIARIRSVCAGHIKTKS